jgi:hypothetical protein
MHVQVVLAIEEEFAIEISHEDAERVNTVADAITYISNHAHVSHSYLHFLSKIYRLIAVVRLVRFNICTGQINLDLPHIQPVHNVNKPRITH